MSTPDPNNLAAPLLEAIKHPGNGFAHLPDPGRTRRASSVRVSSFCLPNEERRISDASRLQVKSFKRTVQALQLDHSQWKTSFISWIVGLLLLVIVPVLRLCYEKEVPGDSEHQLVFQPFVVVVGTALSMVSFLFLSQATRRHGLRGVLFLDHAEEESIEIQEEYDTAIEKGRIVLAKLFFPSFVLYVIFKVWFFKEVQLEPLPFESKTTAASLSILIIFTSLSWIFQTTTYLYSCVLFSTVCSLQELKMTRFKTILEEKHDPEFYYYKYVGIMKGLQATSHRFRSFLALIIVITLMGFLASMYKVVEAERAGIDYLMAGEIVILNAVNLSGVGLCLKSSSKLSHLHRRVVKAATSIHAKITFETCIVEPTPSSSGQDDKLDFPQKLNKHIDVQTSFSRRTALVDFLSSSSAGISVYGFVLDRFFIHASIGAVLTTTWFILGRSLTT